MRNNIKYGASLFVIILSLMFGFVVSAEDNQANTGESKETRDSFMLRGGDNKVKRDEFKNKVKDLRGEVKTVKDVSKSEIATMLEQVKSKRQEFKTQIDTKREEVKTKIEEMKVNLKEDLKGIKDENKKISTEKILDIINKSNTKITDNLSEKTNKIENVLVSIESRISKAEERGLDVSSVKVEAEKAKVAIALAREAIKTQASKVYTIDTTSEATLKADMKKLRDTFKNDIKAVQEKVKSAHVAVKTTATTLAKIPKIEEQAIDDNTPKVEDNSTSNN